MLIYASEAVLVMPGPIPKRSSQRRRRNVVEGGITSAEGAELVEIPEPDEAWHRIARLWYDSLEVSGQSRFYEPSDWATAYLIAESMSRDLEEQVVGITEAGQVVRASIPLKGASLGAYIKAMANLLTTEGDRRRLRLELERPGEAAEAPPGVALMAAYRDAAK